MGLMEKARKRSEQSPLPDDDQNTKTSHAKTENTKTENTKTEKKDQLHESQHSASAHQKPTQIEQSEATVSSKSIDQQHTTNKQTAQQSATSEKKRESPLNTQKTTPNSSDDTIATKASTDQSHNTPNATEQKNKLQQSNTVQQQEIKEKEEADETRYGVLDKKDEQNDEIDQQEQEILNKIREQLSQLQPGDPIRLPVDDVMEYIEKSPNKTAGLKDIAKHIGKPIQEVEYLIQRLESQGVVSVHYPINIFAQPKVSLIKNKATRSSTLELPDDKKLIEQYTVTSDYVTADIRIWSVPFENTPIYEVLPHGITKSAESLIDGMVEELAHCIKIENEQRDSSVKQEAQKRQFFEASKNIVRKHFKDIEESSLCVVAGVLLHKAYGLGELEIIMADNWLEEVAINSHEEPLSLYHKRYGWLKTTKFFNKESEIYNFAAQIGRKVGRQINSLNPIMDAHLETGDRVAATLFPISTSGDTLTIRRFSRNPWTVVHMIDPRNHTTSKEIMSFLWMAIQYELNALVVGGTASGKTSVLNTLCALIPPTNRIISIEDTRELSLPKPLHWNWVPLASKGANTEGQGEVTMLDLMVASLRMRPDRIIVGEIRRKAQAESLFEAMHTGHSVAATMHADTAEQVKRRLTQPPIDIPENELQALQLVIVQYRDRRRGIRRTLEVAELLPGAADEKVNLNYLYRWRPRRDQFMKDDDSIRVIEDMNLHTGMTQNEIENDLNQKGEILQWMLDNRITDVDKVGHVMRIYYKYPKLLIDTVADKSGKNQIFDSKGDQSE